MMVSTNRLIRVWIPVAICSAVGILLFANRFLTVFKEQTDLINTELSAWMLIMGNLGLLNGAYTFLRSKTLTIVHRETREGLMYQSIWCLLLFSLMLGIGIVYWSANTEAYRWIYDYIYGPAQSTIYGLTGVYLFMGAYRGYRAHDISRFFFVLTGILFFLYLAPIGEAIWPGFRIIGGWLYDDLQAFAVRGAVIGMGVAFLLTGLRYLATLDKSYLGVLTEEDK